MNAAIDSGALLSAVTPLSVVKGSQAHPRLDLKTESLPQNNPLRSGAQRNALIDQDYQHMSCEQAESSVVQGWKRFCKSELWRKVAAGVRLLAVEGALFGMASALLSSNLALLPLLGAMIAIYPLANSIGNNRSEQKRAIEVLKLACALKEKKPADTLTILRGIQPADYELMLRGCRQGISDSFTGRFSYSEHQIISRKLSLAMLEMVSTRAWAVKDRLADLGGFVPPPAWLKSRLTEILRTGELSGSSLKRASHLIGLCKDNEK